MTIRPRTEDRPSSAWTAAALRAARGVAVVAAIFSVAVATLLIQNAIQLRQTDPLNDPALLSLRERLAQGDDSPELAGRIRALDLLARRAFFTSQHHIATGGLLLAGGLLTLTLALQLAAALSEKPPPRPAAEGGSAAAHGEARSARAAVTAGGVALLLLAMAGAWTARSRFAPIMEAGAEDGGPPAGPTATPEAPTPVPPAPPTAEQWARNWPGLRGAFGTGVAHADAAPPAVWSLEDGKGIRWRTDLPRGGYSSPIVWESRVFASGGDAQAREVYAFEADTGLLLWRREVGALPNAPDTLPKVLENAIYAAPTPATDGTRVFVLFATGELACFDFEGRQLWARHLGLPVIEYGHSSSPIVWRDRLILQIDSGKAPRLMALRTDTGAGLWETPLDSPSWASPICVQRTDGAWMLIVLTIKSAGGFDPQTGERLWHAPDCIAGETAASAAFDGDTVVVSSVGHGVYAFRPTTGGDTLDPLWHWEDEPANMASPVVANGLVFVVSDYGTVTCLTLEDGRVAWTHDVDAECYASPLVADGRLYVTDRNGDTHLFAAAAKFEALGRSSLGAEVSATPAFVGMRAYIRMENELICLGGTER